ncbi:protein S100-A6-like isoform X2 [Narcine bancroftii]|uniref:protein S100-A6-like isoform X2 n=1 Tax=Narcine bancroftii TaxID=1343680 RepID=UPI003831D9DB
MGPASHDVYPAGSKMKPLEKAMNEIESIFKKYAEKGGDKDSLELDELKSILKQELSVYSDKEYDEIASVIIDKDKNNKLDICEFTILVFCLATHKHPRQKQQKCCS